MTQSVSPSVPDAPPEPAGRPGAEPAEVAREHAPTSFWTLVVGSVGVVYGDIGTSPLYTMREAFGEAGGLHLGEAAVLGVLSLVFWSLVLVVTLKYVVLILRADNRGEGGVLALGTLASRAMPEGHRLRPVVTDYIERRFGQGNGQPARDAAE